jgi:uncharacterized repeat protein (TIGR01451 family)
MHGNRQIAASLNTARLAALLSLVVLCSCQSLPKESVASSVQQQRQVTNLPHGGYPVQNAQFIPGMVSPAGWAGAGRPVLGGHVHAEGQPCPCCGPGTLPAFAFSGFSPDETGLPWKPDGIKGPWPKDEYLCDGGDLNHDVYVKKNWDIVGLDQQDTVAHFDTLDGQTLVAASNCVCVYAPRFAAVRQVSSPIVYEGHERMAGVEKPTKLNVHEETRGPKTALQPEQLIAQVGLDQVQRLRERTQGLLVDQAVRLVLAAEAFLPHEDLAIIQLGQFDAGEKARLAQRVAAAETWTNHQAPQVLVEGLAAVEARGTATPQVTYTYETFGKPCLRLCKIADKSEAKPGEIIQFTLRFDNLGEQKIGNVTIVDNLMPRLEYVAGSAQSSVKATFTTQEQLPGESLVLRWEIEEPLEVNQGGIVRFQARVR